MKLGILGAGQLSRMLVQASEELGDDCNVTVLTDGSVECLEDLKVEVRPTRDVQDLDFITFENEFVNLEPFKVLRSKHPVKFFPSLEVIELVQNKMNQKKLMDRLRLPTSPWKKVESINDVGPTCVLKWARMGYDGKGTLLHKGDTAKAKEFLTLAAQKNVEVYLEEFVSFEREIALVCARNWSGDIVFFPVVETNQMDGICHDVLGGQAYLKGYDEKVQAFAVKILEELNYVGVLAIEMFQKKDGQILINELAPRVHNSGHFSQSTCSISQFEMHLRAGLDLALERPVLKMPYFGMWNLIPTVSVDCDYSVSQLPFLDSKFQLEWYHKSRLRTGRKMGHINFMATELKHIQEMRTELAKWERSWNETLLK